MSASRYLTEGVDVQSGHSIALPSFTAGLARFVAVLRRRAENTVGLWLAKRGRTPNEVTLTGFVMVLAGCASFATLIWFAPAFWIAIGLAIAGALGDLIDGAVASAHERLRAMGHPTTFGKTLYGAMLDSKTDRITDGCMFIALGWVLLNQHQLIIGAVACPLAALGSYMVSYSRARAEVEGLKGEDGWAPRVVRVGLVGLGALVGHFWVGYQLAVYPVLVLAWITVGQRELSTWRQTRNMRPKE